MDASSLQPNMMSDVTSTLEINYLKKQLRDLTVTDRINMVIGLIGFSSTKVIYNNNDNEVNSGADKAEKKEFFKLFFTSSSDKNSYQKKLEGKLPRILNEEELVEKNTIQITKAVAINAFGLPNSKMLLLDLKNNIFYYSDDIFIEQNEGVYDEVIGGDIKKSKNLKDCYLDVSYDDEGVTGGSIKHNLKPVPNLSIKVVVEPKLESIAVTKSGHFEIPKTINDIDDVDSNGNKNTSWIEESAIMENYAKINSDENVNNQNHKIDKSSTFSVMGDLVEQHYI